MATSGLYGSSPTGAVVAAPGSETAGLYGNTTNFGGTYLSGLFFNNLLLRQQHQLAVLGTSQPILELLQQVGQLRHPQAQQQLFGFQLLS